jgi:hypothetical protein
MSDPDCGRSDVSDVQFRGGVTPTIDAGGRGYFAFTAAMYCSAKSQRLSCSDERSSEISGKGRVCGGGRLRSASLEEEAG